MKLINFILCLNPTKYFHNKKPYMTSTPPGIIYSCFNFYCCFSAWTSDTVQLNLPMKSRSRSRSRWRLWTSCERTPWTREGEDCSRLGVLTPARSSTMSTTSSLNVQRKTYGAVGATMLGVGTGSPSLAPRKTSRSTSPGGSASLRGWGHSM